MTAATAPSRRRRGQEIRRSVELFRSFRTEQQDPERFYRLIAVDTLDLVEKRRSVDGLLVLDVGGGHGLYTQEFRDRGARCVLVDIEPAEFDLDGAAALDTLVGDAARLPFADDSFDVVFTSNMLEHVADPDLVRGELARVLKPGGILVLSYTNWLSPWGGHETSPWHLLGGNYAARRYEKRTGIPPKNRFGRSLFAISVADGLRWARSRPDLTVLDSRPRYLPPSARVVLRVPGLREFVTWNLWQVLEKRAS